MVTLLTSWPLELKKRKRRKNIGLECLNLLAFISKCDGREKNSVVYIILKKYTGLVIFLVNSY